MRVAYFDCFSGISGDMTLAALLACGADEAEFRSTLAGLGDLGYVLHTAKVTKSGIEAVDVTVQLTESDKGHARHLSDIAAIINGSTLAPKVKLNAINIFTRLADAEAAIHGTTRDDIHFHEVGAVDAIVDIVGSCILLDMLDIQSVTCSKLPWSVGFVKCQHGMMPLPAPATVKLLERFPVRSTDIEGELITPTGAAIIAALVDPASAGAVPEIKVAVSGFGAGKKQFNTDKPNLLRVIIGESDQPKASSSASLVTVIETNIDDMSPEFYDFFMAKAFASGALDVYFASVQMKKNRPGTLLTVVCPVPLADTLSELILRETTSFGVRLRQQYRQVLEREIKQVQTPHGPISVKVGMLDGIVLKAVPEYEECAAIARQTGLPLQTIFAAASVAAQHLIPSEIRR